MDIGEMLLTHTLAGKYNKSPFFFSRFTFRRMLERKNSHYCFYCGGEVGFQPKKTGLLKRDVSQATNSTDVGGHDAMKRHDATHEDGVIGNALEYQYPSDWLKKEISKKKNFPFVVNIPAV